MTNALVVKTPECLSHSLTTTPLSNVGDKAAMLHGYKRLRDVWANPSLNKLVVREVYPGSDVVSDEDLWRAIQNSATTFHHPVSEIKGFSERVALEYSLLRDACHV